jgi:hypothetical protein
MKRKDREKLAALVPDLLNAVFQQGKAHQRAEDAIADAQFADSEAQRELQVLTDMLNTPEKSEIN